MKTLLTALGLALVCIAPARAAAPAMDEPKKMEMMQSTMEAMDKAMAMMKEAMARKDEAMAQKSMEMIKKALADWNKAYPMQGL